MTDTITRQTFSYATMAVHFVASIVTLVLTSSAFVTSQCPTSGGATESLEEIIVGRCVTYKTTFNPEAVCKLNLNCSEIARNFVTSFSGLPPCNVSMSRYDAFLNQTRYQLTADKSIFWHKTYDLVQQYADRDKRRIPLESTLTGYLIDGLRFCSVEGAGIGTPDTAFCPAYYQTEKCRWNAEASFWSSASKNFAASARGTITVMLNASIGESYNESSYFGLWEVPHLVSGMVTKADIWLVSYPGDVIRSDCDAASIQKLKSHLSSKNITSVCTMNPPDVLWLMCWDYQDNPECRAAATSGGYQNGAFLSMLLLTLLALLLS